ncbi:hypothetical protein PHYBLDRAFT_148247 [Phycomyces blakesleeanus NRRL 1555(-)]|uniref:DDE Tnp4 domain-containing protein n=1 Tax=Phycomyces blakesleeanus (strain ATCC 8743b / DSM 1359 / FGSC 10004 / NBRC 33097 / NRRL 1555) TaxID=763407 RepID=A0A163DG93_PHYB8|nr:hypothetical protein PHYBLDRAFT_148247 [Phycomyces blakesleeanus NRRL 1555(-)]OAD71030.1 hypothetical protein PHYBLDRAFT_148247 [Phycomyces blakesleeanus NRRL 1555(-)]|eukprot:XP_018289070.1 hypothetical protein PHYBLDRAFT_148247 [Phycomyces blakesleeanus NRRL 1555(-)]
MTLALMIVLHRMVFPARSVDLSLLFRKEKSTLSVIFNEMIEKIYIKLYPALKFDYSLAMYCVGFIDGTFNKIARPIVEQEGAYNGHYAYTTSDHMMIPFRRQMADEQELAINKSMSAVRISVGHEFTHIRSLWAFLKYSQTQRSG